MTDIKIPVDVMQQAQAALDAHIQDDSDTSLTEVIALAIMADRQRRDPTPETSSSGNPDRIEDRLKRILFKHIFPRHPCFTDVEMDMAFERNYGSFDAESVLSLMKKAATATGGE